MIENIMFCYARKENNGKKNNQRKAKEILELVNMLKIILLAECFIKSQKCIVNKIYEWNTFLKC